MGFILLIIGLLMIITGARGTYAQFGSMLAAEFTNPIQANSLGGTSAIQAATSSYTNQAIAIGLIGGLGYIPAIQLISRWALGLILLVILLANNSGNTGFFPQLTAALQKGPVPPQAVPQGSNMLASPNQGATVQTPSGAATIVGQGGGTLMQLFTGQTSLWNFLQGSQTNIVKGQ